MQVWVRFCFEYGRVALFMEQLDKAHTLLTVASKLCHRKAPANFRRVAFYLVPLILRRRQYPPLDLLRKTGLMGLYGPIVLAVSTGDLAGFRRMMEARREEFLR